MDKSCSLHQSPAIKAHELTYTHAYSKNPAFSNLSFTLNNGELLCLAGVNGSGKSTLLYLLAGLLPPTAGSLEIFGKNLQQLPEDIASKERKKIAFVVQDADMQILGNTVEEDLLLSFDTSTSPKKWFQKLPDRKKEREEFFAKATTIIKNFSLSDYWKKSPNTLSYGQKRKLCIAGALLSDPSILLLDEPFSGLDYPAIKELHNILLQFRSNGMTIVISSHDLAPIISFTDLCLFLSPDKPYLCGSPNQLLPFSKIMGIRHPFDSNEFDSKIITESL